MSLESAKSNKDPFEPLVWTKDSDGNKSLVKQSELERHDADSSIEEVNEIETKDEERKYTIPSPEKKHQKVEKKGITRRNFFKGIGGAVVTGSVLGSGVIDDIDFDALSKKAKSFADAFEKRIESASEKIPPMEQFIKYGKIKNLIDGIEAVKEEHFRHLVEDKKGRNDMPEAVRNLSGLNIPRFTKPFRDRGLPIQMCYMIAIQETRGKNVTSWGGAEGMMGIMPATAKALGYPDADLHNPYEASEISAVYCAEERKRFESGDMILHAYNTGAGLFGFTKQTEKKDRTPEKFYAYMQEYMNEKFSKYERQKYFTVKVRKGNTLTSLSKKWGVSLQKVFALNGFDKDTVIHPDQKIQMPFVRTETVLKGLFGKEFEALRYTPEVKAKYEALQQQGLLAQLEDGFVKKNSRLS